MSKVEGCVLHTGYLGPTGYGQRRYGKGRRTTAHSVAWMEVNGPIPDGMEVCHRCDNPSCVNVEHMFLGSRSDNMRDCVEKGRQNHVRKAACPRCGSPYSLERSTGKRRCLPCRRQYARARRGGE